MSAKTITRSLRFDEDLNAQLEQLATSSGKSVSEYIRFLVSEVVERESRLAAHRRAIKVFASFPMSQDPDTEREEMWGIGTRVPR
jgi:Arc/MetJ-type ribon-helix-helix transcriptional regulator